MAAGEFAEVLGRVSPDRRWLAFLSAEAGGRPDVYVQAFPEPGHKIRVSSGGAAAVWWMPDGDELCYMPLNFTRMMSAKVIRNGEDLEIGDPRILFDLPADVASGDMTHDGQRMLVTISRGAADNRAMRVILNWTSMLKL